MWGISAVDLTIFWGEPWKDIEWSELNEILWKEKILQSAVQTMEARPVKFQEEESLYQGCLHFLSCLLELRIKRDKNY